MMLLLTLIVVGATAYVWCTRGFFSSLIHMVCVLAAGAIAFGVFEPLSYLILNASTERGTMSFLGGVHWSIGLALPFAFSLAILRLAIDSFLPANAQCDTAADYVGGGVCGAVSGVITAGILVLSIGFLRTPPNFMGYKAVQYTEGTGRGSLQQNPAQLVPWVDRLTAGLYSHLSLTTLRTSDPLAKWYPDFATVPGALRVTYEGSSRNGLKRDAFQFLGWYTVGDRVQGSKFEALLSDTWNDTVQPVSDLRGHEFGAKSEDENLRSGYLAGFIVKFNTKAREKAGQVVIGNGQLRLVCESTTDEEYMAVHPIAVVTNVDDPTKIDYARFRYDGDDIYVASQGGISESVMAFEFPVPRGFVPIALYVKNVRVDVSEGAEPTTFETIYDRDEEIRSGRIAGMGNIGPIIDPNTGLPVQAQTLGALPEPVSVSNAIGFIIQKGTERGLAVAQEGRGWTVREGELKLNIREAASFSSGLDPKLQVNRFSVADDTVIIKVNISPSARSNEFIKALDSSDKMAPPQLEDTQGRTYPAVGFVYKDSAMWWLRFTKGDPIKGLGASGMPTISRTSPDRTLTLVFAVPIGVTINHFKIGNTILDDWSDKPIKVETRQR